MAVENINNKMICETLRRSIGRVIYGNPNQNKNKRQLINALRVPEPGENRRRERNFQGPDFGLQLKYVIIVIATILLYILIAHPSTWSYIFQKLGLTLKPATTSIPSTEL